MLVFLSFFFSFPFDCMLSQPAVRIKLGELLDSLSIPDGCHSHEPHVYFSSLFGHTDVFSVSTCHSPDGRTRERCRSCRRNCFAVSAILSLPSARQPQHRQLVKRAPKVTYVQVWDLAVPQGRHAFYTISKLNQEMINLKQKSSALAIWETNSALETKGGR